MILKLIKNNKKITIILVALTIIIADRFIANKVNEILLADDYYFNQRLAEVELNLETFVRKTGSAKCKVDYKFGIYAYQTCFRPYTYSNDKVNHGYTFIYHETSPKLTLFFPTNNSENYFFKELGLGKKLYFIKRDGTITKLKPYK